MARRGYPPEFRRRVVDLVEGGRKVFEIAAELEVSEQTIYTESCQVISDTWIVFLRESSGLREDLTTYSAFKSDCRADDKDEPESISTV